MGEARWAGTPVTPKAPDKAVVPEIQDRYGRPLRDLRISVNKECNLRCTYCHLEGGAMTGGGITAAEFGRIARIAAGVGIKRLKITGGEPTLRPDLVPIIEAVRPWMAEVSMVTNGILLPRLAVDLNAAGLDRVNISMDTPHPERYRQITRGGDVRKAMAGVAAAVAAGLHPVKVNMVVLKGFNEGDIGAMRRYTHDAGAQLQLIEVHTDRENQWHLPFQESFVSLEATEGGLAAEAAYVEAAPQHGRKRYHLSHADDREALADTLEDHFVEVVRPYQNPSFCADCHRLRVTGDGRLKPCLMRSDNYVDLIGVMRAGATDAVLRARFLEANERRAPYWSAAGTSPRPGGRPLPMA
jgi:GTP 3',8-cyclase